MKRLLAKNSLITILIILIIGLSVVGCGNTNTPDTPNTPNNPDHKEDVLVDKTALNEEIALGITEQGDYTAYSYNEYAAKLLQAKQIANDATASQETVDTMTSELSAARLALTIRPIEEVEGGDKEFRLISGGTKEVALVDYVNVNNLSKISYEVKTNNAVVELKELGFIDKKTFILSGNYSIYILYTSLSYPVLTLW